MDNEMQALGPLEGHVGLGGLPSGGSIEKKTDNEMEAPVYVGVSLPTLSRIVRTHVRLPVP